jgi:hypothetical protein
MGHLNQPLACIVVDKAGYFGGYSATVDAGSLDQ